MQEKICTGYPPFFLRKSHSELTVLNNLVSIEYLHHQESTSAIRSHCTIKFDSISQLNRPATVIKQPVASLTNNKWLFPSYKSLQKNTTISTAI